MKKSKESPSISAILEREASGKTLTASDKKKLTEWKKKKKSTPETKKSSGHHQPEKTKRKEELVSAPELGDILGLTQIRICQLANEGAVIKDARGKYKLYASILSYATFLRENGPRAEAATGDIKEHQARLVKAKADKEEVAAALAKAQVYDAKDVELLWTDMVTTTKTKFFALPTKLAPLLQAETDLSSIKGLLDKALRDALIEMSEYEQSELTTEIVAQDAASLPASPELDPEPVG